MDGAKGKCTKGRFYSESEMRLSNLQKNIPNHYPEHEIWISGLLFLAGNLNFKIRIVIRNIFVWRFDKRIGLSEIKKTFSLENRERRAGTWKIDEGSLKLMIAFLVICRCSLLIIFSFDPKPIILLNKFFSDLFNIETID